MTSLLSYMSKPNAARSELTLEINPKRYEAIPPMKKYVQNQKAYWYWSGNDSAVLLKEGRSIAV